MSPSDAEEAARGVADRATCRTATAAVVGYVALNGTDPRSIADLRSFVDGDLSRYTLVNGKVAGPGCA